MPAKPSWLLRLPAILEELETIEMAIVDRESIQRLFGVKRRRAQQLMAGFGGFEAGRTCLLERDRLKAALRSLQGGAEFNSEQRRKVRVAEQVEAARRSVAARRVRITPAPEPRNALPEGVEIGEGLLRIQFSSAEELLTRLFALSQAIAEDLSRFESWIGS